MSNHSFSLSSLRTLLFLAAGLASLDSARAVPLLVNSGSNSGSDYQVYTASGISWTGANAAATGLTGGWKLVSITTAAEETYVESLLSGFTGDRWHFWIGLTDTASEGTYVWSSGQSFGYSKWHGGEPNNLNNEDYVALDYRSGTWAWNDIPDNGYPNLQKGFIVERSSQVPDGGLTVGLLGLALAGMAALRRKSTRA